MSKLTITQINRVKSSLSTIANNKCILFEQTLPKADYMSGDAIRKLIKDKPADFIKFALNSITDIRYERGCYTNSCVYINRFSPVIKQSNKAQEQIITNQKSMATYRAFLEDEQQKAMDNLILADSPDALKTIDDFKKLEVKST